ncbi:MAG: hypothetical protein ACR2PG_03820, partial [Hyphomicrobiaceae bacterium]
MKIICQTAVILLSISLDTITARAEPLKLSERTSPIPYVSSHVPHVQVGVEPVSKISKELLFQVSNMAGIEIRDTVMSMPGAMGFRLANNVELARPDLGVREREFAHMHPDGSLHAFLSPELAARVVET